MSSNIHPSSVTNSPTTLYIPTHPDQLGDAPLKSAPVTSSFTGYATTSRQSSSSHLPSDPVPEAPPFNRRFTLPHVPTHQQVDITLPSEYLPSAHPIPTSESMLGILPSLPHSRPPQDFDVSMMSTQGFPIPQQQQQPPRLSPSNSMSPPTSLATSGYVTPVLSSEGLNRSMMEYFGSTFQVQPEEPAPGSLKANGVSSEQIGDNIALSVDTIRKMLEGIVLAAQEATEAISRGEVQKTTDKIGAVLQNCDLMRGLVTRPSPSDAEAAQQSQPGSSYTSPSTSESAMQPSQKPRPKFFLSSSTRSSHSPEALSSSSNSNSNGPAPSSHLLPTDASSSDASRKRTISTATVTPEPTDRVTKAQKLSPPQEHDSIVFNAGNLSKVPSQPALIHANTYPMSTQQQQSLAASAPLFVPLPQSSSSASLHTPTSFDPSDFSLLMQSNPAPNHQHMIPNLAGPSFTQWSDAPLAPPGPDSAMPLAPPRVDDGGYTHSRVSSSSSLIHSPTRHHFSPRKPVVKTEEHPYSYSRPSTRQHSPASSDGDSDYGNGYDDRKTSNGGGSRPSAGRRGFSGTDLTNALPPGLKEEVDRIFEDYLNGICSHLEATDSQGDPIHQTLMAKKMARLDESPDFRPFKFRIQAFTNAFQEELARRGYPEDRLPSKKVKAYLWHQQPYISRFNEDGKKSKSKGNHIWHVEAKKLSDIPGKWIFRKFARKIVGTPPGIAYVGLKWSWAPRVWDPQMAREHIEAEFSSPTLPSWLHWNGNVLIGVPGPDAEDADVIVEAWFTQDNQEKKLSYSFHVAIAPIAMGEAAASQSRRPSLAGDGGYGPRRVMSDTGVPQAAVQSSRMGPNASSGGMLSQTPTAAAASESAQVMHVLTNAGLIAQAQSQAAVMQSDDPQQLQVQASLAKQQHVLAVTAHAVNAESQPHIIGLNPNGTALAIAGQQVVQQAARKIAGDRAAFAAFSSPSNPNPTPPVSLNDVSMATQSAVAQAVAIAGPMSSDVDVMRTAQALIESQSHSTIIDPTLPHPVPSTLPTSAAPDLGQSLSFMGAPGSSLHLSMPLPNPSSLSR